MIVQHAAHPRHECTEDSARHGQPLPALLDFLVAEESAVPVDLLTGLLAVRCGGDVQAPPYSPIQLC